MSARTPAWTDPDHEVETMRAASGGDHLAFARLFFRSSRGVLAYVALSLPPDRVEDVTRRIYSRAWVELSLLDTNVVRSFDAWLLAIADEELVAADAELAEANLATLAAGSLLRALPELHRQTLALRFLFGRSRDEVATALGESDEHVAQVEWQALAQLSAARFAVDQVEDAQAA